MRTAPWWRLSMFIGLAIFAVALGGLAYAQEVAQETKDEQQQGEEAARTGYVEQVIVTPRSAPKTSRRSRSRFPRWPARPRGDHGRWR